MYHFCKLTNGGRSTVIDNRTAAVVLLFVLLFFFFANRGCAPQAGANASTGIETAIARTAATNEPLYLLDKAAAHIADTHAFEDKVRQVSRELNIAPEWLMAVMYAESRFNPSVANHKGSGAVGLIQFMPDTFAEMFGQPIGKLRNITSVEQMDYVQHYLQKRRDKYGEFDILTDLYLAILYPEALEQDYCFTLYDKWTKPTTYKLNSGLDKNKNGRVTVQDIDRHLKNIYPTAYLTPKPTAEPAPGVAATIGRLVKWGE